MASTPAGGRLVATPSGPLSIANSYNIVGPQLDATFTEGMRYFDLYHGTELKPKTNGRADALSLDLEANGYGAILATPDEPSNEIKALMVRNGRHDCKAASHLSA